MAICYTTGYPAGPWYIEEQHFVLLATHSLLSKLPCSMVYVNSKKFACESCIKGHRSSSCHHTERPLFEIKKKGRPVSQCTKCRELRQSKKFHSKCNCNPQKDEAPAVQPLSSSSTSKTRRFIPIVPALPNGLKDVLDNSQSVLPPDSRQRVDSLLNPCNCKNIWKCKCKNSEASGSNSSSSTSALSTLAHAAAMQCCSPSPKDLPDDENNTKLQNTMPHSRPTTPIRTPQKRHRNDKIHNPSPGPDLAPIYYSPSSSYSFNPSTSTPEFPSMPPMSAMNSLAGTGCTCGVQCSCPGCTKHRGERHANHDRSDCDEGCGTCIDPTLEMHLPSTSGPSHTGKSFLDRFFARAAALPPPPVNRKMRIDPMDLTPYIDSTKIQGSNTMAFGSVNLPKLECCGGLCNCPDGRCTCRASCGGCCADTKEDKNSAKTNVTPSTPESPPPIRSCCAE